MSNTLGSLAEGLFMKGYNCSESISKAVADSHSISSREIPKIATPFGAGLGRSGSLCGCLSGGLIGVGLLHGRSDPADKEGKNLAYERAKTFYNRFVGKFGSSDCTELCGVDISTQEGLERYHRENIRAKCAIFVRETGDILSEIL